MRLVYVGPLTPPIHGKSLATQRLAKSLMIRGVKLEVIDVSEGIGGSRWRKLWRKLRAHLVAIAAIGRVTAPVYISVNASGGMWLTTLLAFMARLMRRPLLLHHHSYEYISATRFRMAALSLAAGRRAVHIVLGQRMANDLAHAVAGLGPTFILNNAGLIDQTLTNLPTANGGGAIVLGHLSNLTAEKGVLDVVRVAIAARRQGMNCRLVLAGPRNDAEAHAAIERAEAEMGSDFDYRGAVYGTDKHRFFSDITHFVFPTRYSHEAAPLVLLEAMASGVPCIATARGCIPDDIGANGGVAVDEDADFVTEALAQVERPADRNGARERYRELLREHEAQLERLTGLIDGLS